MGVRQGVHNTGKNITFSSIQTSQVLFFYIFCIFGYTLHLITKVQRCPNFPKSLPPFSDQELSGNDICFLWCVFFPLLNSYLNVPFVGFYPPNLTAKTPLSSGYRWVGVPFPEWSSSPPARLLPIAFHYRRKGIIPDKPQRRSTVKIDAPPPLKVEGLHSDLQILNELIVVTVHYH